VSGEGWHVQDLFRAAGRLGVGLEAVGFEKLTGHVGDASKVVSAGGRPVTPDVGVLVRMMPPGSLEQVIFRMDVLHRLERAGVALLNRPRAVEVSVDKYLSLALLECAGVPIPPTAVGESAADALDAFERLGGDVVVKPLFGSEGRGLVRVSDREVARRVFTALERIGSALYVQKYVAHRGHDCRLFVLGGRILGSIRRHAADGEWRTNVALGARPEPFTPDSAQERLALAAAQAVGADMAGVDLIDDPENGATLVLEVNAVPGWRALAGATAVDVASEILDHLRSL
jgi:ribosomal protein S6--L-glutamate ligase